MRWKASLAGLQVAFLLRGMLLISAIPIWEGLDEWAHFAAVETVRQTGYLPHPGDRISVDIHQSRYRLPASRIEAQGDPALIPHDDFGRRPVPEPLGLLRQTGLPPVNYESQQPPLPHHLLSWVALPAGVPIGTRVWWLRFVNLLILSASIPLTYLAWGYAFPQRDGALLAAAVVALLPGFLINNARVSNDALAVVASCLVVVAALRYGRVPGPRSALWLGGALAMALMMKASLLLLVGLAVPLALWHPRQWRSALLAATVPALASGWWYAGNLRTTGTLSGEQVDAAGAAHGLMARLSAFAHIDWFVVAKLGHGGDSQPGSPSAVSSCSMSTASGS